MNKGLTLLTTLVYAALLAVIATLLARVAVSFIRANTLARLNGEVADSAQRALAQITQEIQQADRVYPPTSVFNTHPGQLSLVTTQNLPADEDITYLDFYIDDEHLYLKREGAAAALLTSQQVKVSHLTFTHLYPTGQHQAIRLNATFTADVPGSDVQTQTSLPLTSTISLRKY